MGPRANLVLTLLAATATLIVAIVIGNEMGNRVLGGAIERGPAIGATPVAPAADLQTNGPSAANWRHEQIVSVATDPAFPDPRVTPLPPPTAPPRPVFVATASPTPSRPPATATPPKVRYTSPPLPIPLVSHGPEADPNATSEPTPAGGDVPPAPPATP